MGRFARQQHQTFRQRLTEKVKAIRFPEFRGATSPGKDAAMRNKMSGSSGISRFNRLAHWPERLHWMDPLSLYHRWGIAGGLLLILIGFFLPGESTQFPVQQTIDTSSAVMQAQTDTRSEDSDTPAPSSSRDPQGQWHNYTIAAGQTLAQLFRDNNLPVGDVFAMAQVEGQDKPLSNLQTGQQVRLRINSRGTVTGLTLTTKNGPVLFTRQEDGSFIQAQ